MHLERDWPHSGGETQAKSVLCDCKVSPFSWLFLEQNYLHVTNHKTKTLNKTKHAHTAKWETRRLRAPDWSTCLEWTRPLCCAATSTNSSRQRPPTTAWTTSTRQIRCFPVSTQHTHTHTHTFNIHMQHIHMQHHICCQTATAPPLQINLDLWMFVCTTESFNTYVADFKSCQSAAVQLGFVEALCEMFFGLSANDQVRPRISFIISLYAFVSSVCLCLCLCVCLCM